MRCLFAILCFGCAPSAPIQACADSPPDPGGTGAAEATTQGQLDHDDAVKIDILVNARNPGTSESVQLRVEDGTLTAIGPTVDTTGATPTDAGGRFVSPGLIDSHVHLAYLPQADELAAGGIVAAVDLAAPLAWLADKPDDLQLLASGPMLTAPGGYPTTSWGRHGYGIECATTEAAVAAVDALVDAGAQVVKVPLAGGPEHSDETLAAIADRTHHHGLRLAVHALGDEGAARASAAGADVLVHVPTEPLQDSTVAAWSGRAVIPTLAAFGTSAAAVDNLRRLQAAGATVLYGTDFGNARVAGISQPELDAMADAGMSAEAVWASATRIPADFWGWPELGRLEVGAQGSLWLTERDPTLEISTLAEGERWPSH